MYSQEMSTVTTFIVRWFEMFCPELRFGGVQLLGHGLMWLKILLLAEDLVLRCGS